MSRTALYRWFDEDGALLYVGISNSPAARAIGHGASSWWQLVARCDVQWFDTRGQARQAERTAITAEDPIYNVAMSLRLAQRPPAPAVSPTTTGRVNRRLLQRTREYAGLGRRDLAARTGGLVTAEAIRLIETGRSAHPREATIAALATALDLQPSALKGVAA